MRAPIYRNLDQPFQVMGFSVAELTFLTLILVGGGELFQLLGVHRVWAFVATLILAIVFFVFRRSFGDLFVQRLLRFLRLPGALYPKLFLNSMRGGPKP